MVFLSSKITTSEMHVYVPWQVKMLNFKAHL